MGRKKQDGAANGKYKEEDGSEYRETVYEEEDEMEHERERRISRCVSPGVDGLLQ
jgi:hypothetical protein